jgi:hypothetical protein
MADNQKLSLQTFLQLLASKNLPISRAMTVASKMCCFCPLSENKIAYSRSSFSYKDFNTPARLGELTDSKLLSLGVLDKEDRRLVLSALNATGYRATAVTNAKQHEAKKRRSASANRTAGAKDSGNGGGSISDSPNNGEPSTVQ